MDCFSDMSVSIWNVATKLGDFEDKCPIYQRTNNFYKTWNLVILKFGFTNLTDRESKQSEDLWYLLLKQHACI